MKQKYLVPVTLGETVFNCGYSFIVADITTYVIDGKAVYRYKGYCTADPRNDSIRHTGYNGASYGGLLLAI